jgi:hypothetical protein
LLGQLGECGKASGPDQFEQSTSSFFREHWEVLTSAGGGKLESSGCFLHWEYLTEIYQYQSNSIMIHAQIAGIFRPLCTTLMNSRRLRCDRIT